MKFKKELMYKSSIDISQIIGLLVTNMLINPPKNIKLLKDKSNIKV